MDSLFPVPGTGLLREDLIIHYWLILFILIFSKNSVSGHYDQ